MKPIEKDTKQVIIKAANKLFAAHGFEGTSIRDIARAADVNLAAINYHFNNKVNLYWKVFDFNYDWMKTGIEQLGKKETSMLDLTLATYRFFMNNSTALMNTFRIFLNEDLKIDKADEEFFEQKRLGPPGQEVFMQKLRLELGDKVPDESLYWVVKMTFGLLVHFGVMLNTKVMRERCELDPQLRPDFVEN